MRPRLARARRLDRAARGWARAERVRPAEERAHQPEVERIRWRKIRLIFQWSGDWTFATGLPFTPRLLNEACEVNGGTSGTLRPDVVAGEAVQLSHPSIGEWFNTAAFASPSTCQYGTARRNSIIGPGTKVFDMAFTKVIPLQESRTLEFRAQATNVFNMPNYSSIDTNLNSPTYGRVTAVGS